MTSWTAGKVLSWATEDFKKKGLDSPRLEAELLLASVLGCTRMELYTGFDRPLIERELSAYKVAITARRAGEPAAYIIGKKEFWSLDFEVDSRVLVPRPETEILVEATLARLSDNSRLLDLGTGSGCIAVSLASERSDIEVDAVDISSDACEVARANTKRHGVADRVHVIEGDLFEPLPEGRRYAAIVANPPYVPESEIAGTAPEVQKEPKIALAAGPDGLDVIRRILAASRDFLLQGGWLLMEVDPRHVDELIHNFGSAVLGVEGEVILDLAGRERIVVWQIP